MKKKIHFSF